MLPGYVSGFYTYEECHIDLGRLSRYAGAALVQQEATGIDIKVGRAAVCVSGPYIQNNVCGGGGAGFRSARPSAMTRAMGRTATYTIHTST
jgi:hypothetical protein